MVENNELRELLRKYHHKPEPSILTALTAELYPLINDAYVGLGVDHSWNRDHCISVGHGKLLLLLTNPDILKAESVRAFVRRCLKNAMLDSLKYQHEILGLEDDARNEMSELSLPGPDVELTDLAMSEERLFAVMEALDSLSIDRRTMIYLYFFAGWTLQEISDSFGWGGKGHVSEYVHRATQELSSNSTLRSLFH